MGGEGDVGCAHGPDMKIMDRFDAGLLFEKGAHGGGINARGHGLEDGHLAEDERGPGASAQTALLAAVSLLFGGLWAAVLLAPTSFVLPQLRRRLVAAAPHRAPRPLAARLERPG